MVEVTSRVEEVQLSEASINAFEAPNGGIFRSSSCNVGSTSSNALLLSGSQLSLDLSLLRKSKNLVLVRSCSLSSTELDGPLSSDDEDSSSSNSMKNVSPEGRFKRTTITCWEKGELLGQGSFGTVYQGISGDGFFFAVKEVSLLNKDMPGRALSKLEQEINLWSEFEHENIVQYYGTDKDEATLYVFQELIAMGSLRKLYQKYHFKESQIYAYTRQILHGLKYLHDKNVIHRDIKCANILVDANGSVKLADFGLSKEIKDINSCQGTAHWMAPEVVNYSKKRYGLPADIWSLGCTVLEMFTREIPYSHLEWAQAVFKIASGKLPRVPSSLSRDAHDFIMQCLQVNPADRPNASQLLEHPFVKRPLSSLSEMESTLVSGQC